jgi:rifampin ADP-ribosylating transferase
MIGGPAHCFHGTKVALRAGDRIVPGHAANYGSGRPGSWVYMTARLEIAVLAAELAEGDGASRVYVVEPEGEVEDDPNVTDKKFPGNPTRSYRARVVAGDG